MICAVIYQELCLDKPEETEQTDGWKELPFFNAAIESELTFVDCGVRSCQYIEHFITSTLCYIRWTFTQYWLTPQDERPIETSTDNYIFRGVALSEKWYDKLNASDPKNKWYDLSISKLDNFQFEVFCRKCYRFAEVDFSARCRPALIQWSKTKRGRHLNPSELMLVQDTEIRHMVDEETGEKLYCDG